MDYGYEKKSADKKKMLIVLIHSKIDMIDNHWERYWTDGKVHPK